MTDISINEMIVKVNAPAFHDNFVEASVNVTDFPGRALLTRDHTPWSEKKNVI